MRLTLFAAALALTASFTATARADYAMPPVEVGFSEITAILDATVESFDVNGRATLKVHEVIYGDQTQTTIDGVSLTCMGGSVQNYGVLSRQRYIFFLREEQMYEEQSYFPVTASKDGTQTIVTVKDYYKDWLKLPAATLTREELILALRARLAQKRPRAPR